MFRGRVIRIVICDRMVITKHRRSFMKRHAVLPLVVDGFLVIPFELHGHIIPGWSGLSNPLCDQCKMFCDQLPIVPISFEFFRPDSTVCGFGIARPDSTLVMFQEVILNELLPEDIEFVLLIAACVSLL